MSKRPPALGRGLSALLQNVERENKGEVAIVKDGVRDGISTVGMVAILKIDQIVANPFQPRTKFERETLLELANSIKELGLIQPITVRKIANNKYQLISGERRFRAVQIAKKETLPAFIRNANDQEMLEMALVENIQRENLDAIEIAFSYQKLIEECALTQEELSERVGKKRSTVTNYLRLLKLPAKIQMAIRSKQISMGHARAIVGLETEKKQLNVCEEIIDKGLSVRDVEQLVKPVSPDLKGLKSSAKKKVLPKYYKNLETELKSTVFKTIRINLSGDKKGSITIPFSSKSELEQIKEKLRLLS